MQIRNLPRHLIRLGCRASRLLAAQSPDIEAARRRDACARWTKARANGLSAKSAAEVVGVPLATLYRWKKQAQPLSRRPKRPRKATWSSELVQAVEALRLDEPMWGRAKIAVKLRDQGFKTSEATVGRIIAHLVKRGVVEPVPTIRRGAKTRKWSAKRRFAERLPKHLKASEPGDIVQIDTLYVTLAPGKHVKHFTGYDPIAKWTAAQAFERATATSAALFLDKIQADMPFPVRAIQVDGGSEFMAEFETACEKRGITLYVLPPKSPEINGAVERCNSSWRYEFYAVYDLPHRLDELNPLIDAFQHRYNNWRPHGALGGKTPAQYLQARHVEETSRSQMS